MFLFLVYTRKRLLALMLKKLYIISPYCPLPSVDPLSETPALIGQLAYSVLIGQQV